MDARTFLGMEPVGDDLHWRMQVEPQLTTPGNFLFGGCGLGAALVVAAARGERPAATTIVIAAFGTAFGAFEVGQAVIE